MSRRKQPGRLRRPKQSKNTILCVRPLVNDPDDPITEEAHRAAFESTKHFRPRTRAQAIRAGNARMNAYCHELRIRGIAFTTIWVHPKRTGGWYAGGVDPEAWGTYSDSD